MNSRILLLSSAALLFPASQLFAQQAAGPADATVPAITKKPLDEIMVRF